MDPQGQALKGVQVGETQTDATGHFSLKERRYYAFLLKEIWYMEAPPIFISEVVILNGYQSCKIQAHDSRGGGRAKGATWAVGQIVLYPSSSTSMQKSPEDCAIKNQ
ncbi:hypothetical protein EC844_101244 [Acinetobacter calcoaceticus]|uniref:Uncharacterized protein n=1 Tax=Acinetobacter calcoaceticus TaxID=471 RepID=A0A4R1Y6V7_ACICA|nr:hypothetical protein EC844_101244 [Acinetobacter calcoaceticus]